MRIPILFFATPLLLLAHSAFADEVDRNDLSVVPSSASGVRVSASGMIGLASYDRAVTSPQSESGGGYGGEVRIHPDSVNGAFFAAQTGGALFGPTLTTIDLGYSLRPFAPQRLKGITGSLYFDVGPSVGLVWVPQGFHNDLGGVVGVAFDLQIWNVTVGAQVTYHGGLPIDGGAAAQWESSFMGGLRLGFAFDLGHEEPTRRSPPRVPAPYVTSPPT
jgi:hypothetical protein